MELSFESVLSVVPKTKSSAPNDEEAALVVFFADGYREIKAKELIKEILIHKPVSFLEENFFMLFPIVTEFKIRILYHSAFENFRIQVWNRIALPMRGWIPMAFRKPNL